MGSVRRLMIIAGSGSAAVAAYASLKEQERETAKHDPWHDTSRPPITRQMRWLSLVSGHSEVDHTPPPLAGGATGAGIALDAQTRGLRTALVEAEDFASGTSSRSTKLLHGGVRYLEKAFWQADLGQLNLVLEALKERSAVLRNAPHITNPLPTIMPCYRLWEVPYFWAGLKFYDLLAGFSGLTWSSLLSSDETFRVYPQLARSLPTGETLKASLVYYDGQMDDARLNVALATTAAGAGAAVMNYVSVVSLIKDAAGKVVGATCVDNETGAKFDVRAKCVVNAAGPFCDGVRKMGQADARPMITPSSGVHLTLPGYFSPDGYGFIVPKTKDGRVVFVLPWLGHTVAGTTDQPTQITTRPEATDAEVSFILDTLSDYLSVKVDKSAVTSSWSGIRPLAADPTRSSTENLVRDHVVAVENGLVTISGGKWTTYRKMAEDAVDAAVAAAGLSPQQPCRTEHLRLVGGGRYSPSEFVTLKQTAQHPGVELDISEARHLARAYGDRAPLVIGQCMAQPALRRRLDPAHPVLEAEVVFAAQHEMCRTAGDFLARRSRLAFLDARAAERALPRVVELLGRELGWSGWRQREELSEGKKFLATFTKGL